MENKKHYVENTFWAFFGVILTCALGHYIDCVPEIETLNKNVNEIRLTLLATQKYLYDLHETYVKNDEDGRECIVGFNANLNINEVSVTTNNKLGLKRGDRIEITYLYGVTKVSIECFVYLVDEGNKTKSDAALFVSKKCLEMLQVPKEKWKDGIFHVNFKKIVKLKSNQDIPDLSSK